MLYIADGNHILQAHNASMESLVLPEVKTSTTAMLSHLMRNFFTTEWLIS